MGRGEVRGLGAALGRFVVATMEQPWRVAGPLLGATPGAVVFVESMEEAVLERQLGTLPVHDTVVGVGGGQAVDLGKYLAWRGGARLVTVPTALSVDAFVTPAAGIRRSHQVEYVGETSPDPLVIDFDLIRTAPPHLNIAGTGDLLSIHTASHDWERAERAGRSEYPFSPADVAAAREILREVEGQASEIQALTDRGLETIVRGCLRMNTICLPAGHYRVEEGSEHFLFYELEERLGRPFIHGEIVGLGLYLMSRLQENRPDWITGLMDRLGLRYQPEVLGIRREDLVASLRALPAFCARRGLWYSVIQERPATPGWIEEALRDLVFA
jgi:glycerol-1-phosphate dehydrogenase [NAD(P)+]